MSARRVSVRFLNSRVVVEGGCTVSVVLPLARVLACIAIAGLGGALVAPHV